MPLLAGAAVKGCLQSGKDSGRGGAEGVCESKERPWLSSLDTDTQDSITRERSGGLASANTVRACMMNLLPYPSMHAVMPL